jgi:4-diphosphocytidyl-2C-methyl-D-erythritol kinase
MSMSRLKQIADVLEVPVINLISEDVEKPSQTLLEELQEAKKVIAAHAQKINQLQEYVITLYEQIHKQKQNLTSN